MAGSLILLLVLRWTHILSAIALMGGAIFQRFALLPAVTSLGTDTRQQLHEVLRPRWARLVMATSGLLLLSGLVNFALTLIWFQFDRGQLLGKSYHMLFGVKFMLALVVFILAALLSGRSAAGQKLRQNARGWLSVNLVLATVVVLLGGCLRFAPRTEKSSVSYLPRVAQHEGLQPGALPR